MFVTTKSTTLKILLPRKAPPWTTLHAPRGVSLIHAPPYSPSSASNRPQFALLSTSLAIPPPQLPSPTHHHIDHTPPKYHRFSPTDHHRHSQTTFHSPSIHSHSPNPTPWTVLHTNRYQPAQPFTAQLNTYVIQYGFLRRIIIGTPLIIRTPHYPSQPSHRHHDHYHHYHPITIPTIQRNISQSPSSNISQSPSNNLTIDLFNMTQDIPPPTPTFVDLNTITDPTIRAQIDQLLFPTSHNTTPTDHSDPPTYADIAATNPIPNYPTDDVETIDEEDTTPFTIVPPRTRPTHAPPTHGISGVISASSELWNEHENTRILNQDDLNNQRRRLTEGRVHSIQDVTRLSMWIKFYFPTVIPTLPVAPNILQQELAIDHIIALTHVDYPIDRIFIGTLTQPYTFDNVQCFLCFAALSPASTLTYGASQANTRTALTHLYTLENRLHRLFRDPSQYRSTTTASSTNIPPLLPHITFKLPHVNHHTEYISFIISGLPPQVPHNDVATLRELAADIFRSITNTYTATTQARTLPSVLLRHTSRFHINQLLSVRAWSLTTPTLSTTSRGRGRGRRPNQTTTERLLALVTATSSNPAVEFVNLVSSLNPNHDVPFSICGGKLDITLIPYHTLPRPNTPAFFPMLQRIKTANTANYSMSHVRIVRDLPVNQRTISTPTHITRMVQNTPLCRAIVVNLQNGRTEPSITCLLEHSTDTTINSNTELFNTLARTITEFDISPKPPSHSAQLHQHFPSTISVTTTTSPTATPTPNTHQFGRSLPTTICTNPSSLRYHVLPNPAGGIAYAGVYKGHFDNDNYRIIAEHVSHPYFKSFSTEWEAMHYFRLFFPQCTTRAKILFLNYNAPMESSNMNNPSPRLRQLIGTSTNNPRVRTLFEPDNLEPFIVLSRQAASRRMREQGLTPIDSFDFLPPDHPREFHSPSDLPIDLSELPTPPTTTTNPPTNNLSTFFTTILATTTPTDDDNMSQLSFHTHTSLSLHHHAGETTLTQPNTPISKRPRTTTPSDRSISTTDHHTNLATLKSPTYPTHIALILPILTTKADIITTITTHSNFTISDCIYFATIITNPATKLCYITVNQHEHITEITTLLLTHYPSSAPRTLVTLPTFLFTTQTIDTASPTHTALPTNCRVIQCPLYNNGIEEPPPTDAVSLFMNLQQHGLGIHSHLYHNTPDTTLNAIGWTRCCTNCPNLNLGETLATEHRHQCAIYAHAHPSDNTTIHPTQQHLRDDNQSDDQSSHTSDIKLSQTSLFDSCPPTHHNDLQTLIDTNATPAIINAQILRWHATAGNALNNEYDDDL